MILTNKTLKLSVDNDNIYIILSLEQDVTSRETNSQLISNWPRHKSEWVYALYNASTV